MKKICIILLVSLLPTLGVILAGEFVVRIFLKETLESREALTDVDLGKETFPLFQEIKQDGHTFLKSTRFPAHFDSAVPRDPEAGLLLKEKHEKVFRVFALGGSSTAGQPYGYWGSFSRFLRDALRHSARPGVRVEVFNFGIPSGTSTSARLVMEKVWSLKPDLVIAYLGHNEFCDSYRYMNPNDSERVLQNISDYLYRISYAYKWATQKYQYRRSRLQKDYVDYRCLYHHSKTSKESFENIPSVLKSNLKSISELVKRGGGHFLMLNQVSSLVNKSSKPVKEYVSGDQKKDIVKFQRKLLHGGWSDTKAIEWFSLKYPNSEFSYFLKGSDALLQGDIRSAEKYLHERIERRIPPRQYRQSYTPILASVASEHKNASFLDLVAYVRSWLGDGLFDGRLLVDPIHPNTLLHRKIAQFIFEEYFVSQMLRPDLFRYEDVAGITYDVSESDIKNYPFICSRYARSSTWKSCYSLFVLNYIWALNHPDPLKRRRLASAWELLSFYGRHMNDEKMIEVSEKIFQHAQLSKTEIRFLKREHEH